MSNGTKVTDKEQVLKDVKEIIEKMQNLQKGVFVLIPRLVSIHVSRRVRNNSLSVVELITQSEITMTKLKQELEKQA